MVLTFMGSANYNLEWGWLLILTNVLLSPLHLRNLSCSGLWESAGLGKFGYTGYEGTDDLTC